MLEKINFGFLMGILCIFVGTVMLINLRAFFVFHPKKSLKKLLQDLSIRQNRKKLFLALAGTLGVGNIYGVAIGIIVGGAGSVFWMAVSSIFALVIKYSESSMAAYFNNGKDAGMMGVLPQVFPKSGTAVSKIYAFLMILLAFIMGAFIQSDSIIGSLSYVFSLNRFLSAVLFLVSVFVVIVGGSKKIKNAVEFIIPAVCVTYIVIALCVIFSHITKLNTVVSEVLYSAFSPKALLGIFPAVNTVAFSEGFARGILSNEAGVGTSTIANAEGDSKSCAGLFGMCEIFFDTSVLCMLTAFMILLAIDDPSAYASPMNLIFDSVTKTLGEYSKYILLLCIFLFAYSTVICWYHYGFTCLCFLRLERYKNIFLFFFLLSIISASFLSTYIAVKLTDFLLLLMSIPMCISILKSRKQIADITRESGLLK